MTRLGPGGSAVVLTGALCRVSGQHRFWLGDKDLGNVAPSGSVIARCAIRPGGDRGTALRKDAGVMVISDPS